MKNSIYLFSFILVISCGKSIEKDAKKMADLMCKTYDTEISESEKNEFLEKIGNIENNYSEEEKTELQNLAEDLFVDNCGDKVALSLGKNETESSNLENKNSHLQNEELNTQSSETNNYDKMLDDYESYVNQYIALIKKASTGDQSAILEYPKFMQKAQQLEQSMKQAENSGQLTIQQAKRMNDINFKMLEEAQKMQSNY